MYSDDASSFWQGGLVCTAFAPGGAIHFGMLYRRPRQVSYVRWRIEVRKIYTRNSQDRTHVALVLENSPIGDVNVMTYEHYIRTEPSGD